MKKYKAYFKLMPEFEAESEEEFESEQLELLTAISFAPQDFIQFEEILLCEDCGREIEGQIYYLDQSKVCEYCYEHAKNMC